MALSIPCGFTLLYLSVGRVGNVTDLWERNDSAISTHQVIFLDSIRRAKKSNNIPSSTMGLRCETKVGIQNTSVSTTAGRDLHKCINTVIGEDDVLAVRKCCQSSIEVRINIGNDALSNGSFIFANSEGQRALAINLLRRSSHLDDWDFVNDLDGHRTSDSWFSTGCPRTDKASVDGKWIASLGHCNNELSGSLTVISVVVESSKVRVSGNSSLGSCTDSSDS
mmetsp:Transcript_41930/g.101035  ORF Transcript_41930/g.101035 Transcript_41930/m.101035 type:complete len:223 (+) Transcript_41930:122-790(+)